MQVRVTFTSLYAILHIKAIFYMQRKHATTTHRYQGNKTTTSSLTQQQSLTTSPKTRTQGQTANQGQDQGKEQLNITM